MKRSELLELLAFLAGLALFFGGMIWWTALPLADSTLHWPSFVVTMTGISICMGLTAFAARPRS